MDNTILINAIIRFVESHIKENIEYKDIEKAVGLSYRYFREEFRSYAEMPLKQYINFRKIANIIFEMETTDKTLLTLANDYGFDAYDTFTRSFNRIMSTTPNLYRKEKRYSVERKLIGIGTYAPVVTDTQILDIQTANLQDDDLILYGVPKIEFSNGKCTPFPACMESALTYMGQRENCSYTWLMGASGAAFRFCWNGGEWDMGNCNLMNITLQNPWTLYEHAFNAAGRKCNIVEKSKSTKENFVSCIVNSIDRGNPVIALGIVGPPEACIITGYEEQGEHLFGWSYFQENPEFSSNVKIDKSGYFISLDWYDNPSTMAIITLGEETTPTALYEILQNIYSVLTMQSSGVYHAGQSAYKSWATDISEDRAFRDNSITPILLSRFFCQADAETMIGEGRYWGAQFFKQLGEKHSHISELCFEAADLFSATAGYAQQMTIIRQGDKPTEEPIEILCRQDTRREISDLIYKAQAQERKAIPIVERILQQLR